jgi:hypothetical protein
LIISELFVIAANGGMDAVPPFLGGIGGDALLSAFFILFFTYS